MLRTDLRALGIVFFLEGGKVKLTNPDRLTPDLKNRVRTGRAAIVDQLHREERYLSESAQKARAYAAIARHNTPPDNLNGWTPTDCYRAISTGKAPDRQPATQPDPREVLARYLEWRQAGPPRRRKRTERFARYELESIWRPAFPDLSTKNGRLIVPPGVPIEYRGELGDCWKACNPTGEKPAPELAPVPQTEAA